MHLRVLTAKNYLLWESTIDEVVVDENNIARAMLDGAPLSELALVDQLGDTWVGYRPYTVQLLTWELEQEPKAAPKRKPKVEPVEEPAEEEPEE